MKTAFLIDCESLGGGCEYIRRKSDERTAAGNACRTFYSVRGECRPSVVDHWGADEIVVNHLKALLQLLGCPWQRPHGRVRFVVHGIHLRKYDWQHGLKARLARLARRKLESWLYHRCDEIVALTESDRADIRRLYGSDLKVTVEPNTLVGWTPHLADGLPPGVTGSFAYVCIGRFNFQKGQDRWIKEEGRRKKEEGRREKGEAKKEEGRREKGEAKKEEGRREKGEAKKEEGKKEGVEERTLFIGEGETLESCRRLAEELGVAERCVFAGAIPDAERYLKCAATVVSPSRWEGMPYLLMKARALGCRILATDCPGNRDVLAGYEKWEKLEL